MQERDDDDKKAKKADQSAAHSGHSRSDASGQATEGPVAGPISVDEDKSLVLAGTLINNNYRIIERIASGGMGEVYRGENPLSGEQVAIKIVLDSISQDRQIIDLFVREARTLCRLSHKAIVRSLNFVRDKNLDRYCLIMEYIDGVPLSDHLKTHGPLPIDAAVTMIRILSEGLFEAHQKLVFHRDLSPDNVMFRNGDIGHPVLIDFGIAKSTEMIESTVHGQVAGKFKYISPEQLGDYEGLIGPRTDVYSLALLVIAAIRSEPIDMGGNMAQAVDARRKIPCLDGVPERLRPMLAHMLEPNPKNRPANMMAVLHLLDNPIDIPEKYGATLEWLDQYVDDDSTVIMSHQQVTARFPFDAVTGSAPVTLAPNLETSSVPGTLGPTEKSTLPRTIRSATPHPMDVFTSPARRRRRRRSAIRWFAILVILASGGLVAAQRNGMLQQFAIRIGLIDPLAEGEGTASDSGGDASAAPLPAKDQITRDGFLANLDTGFCSYVDRVQSGLNTGTLEGFATEKGRFDGVQDTYSEKFGIRPSLTERQIDASQCPVLDFIKSYKAGAANPPVLSLDSDILTGGGGLVGRLSDLNRRQATVFLVTNTGVAVNLAGFLIENPDGSFGLQFGIGTEVSEPTPFLILAIATNSGLAGAALGGTNAQTADLLDKISGELALRGETPGVALKFLLKRP